jgi:hypothetical protein
MEPPKQDSFQDSQGSSGKCFLSKIPYDPREFFFFKGTAISSVKHYPAFWFQRPGDAFQERRLSDGVGANNGGYRGINLEIDTKPHQ